MPIIRTQATEKIIALHKRIRAVQGGTSAGKTIGILQDLIDQSESEWKSPTITSIVSESFPHLKRGVIRDFIAVMQDLNHWDDNRWNKTDYIYTFPSGSKIEFFSADQPGKVRGPRRDRLFINEANNIPFDTFDQLEVRTKEAIYLDWNPSNSFWFYDSILGKRDDVDHIILTYKDNSGLDPAIVSSIEQRKDRKGWWTVFGDGQLGEVEGKIYHGWAIIDEIPHEARLERYGVDFGYTNDPTAIVAVYYYNGGYILDEIVCATGMSNRQIADTLLNCEQKALVIADSAEPKSIDEIRGYGVNIMGVEKKRGETKNENFKKWSIGLVQAERISVTKQSTYIIKEYRNYLWMTDRDGKVLNLPEHEFSHTMDAITYAFVSIKKIGSQVTPVYIQKPYEPMSAFEGGGYEEQASGFIDNTINF